ncbi:hypothetical protein EVAR_102260_1 [Eumeta japonica]|uniref:Uncharacterized protein n=1 Tax=Eumeta variegata TaxID=151549 RepID=A0A4C1ZQ94_EUMVA|nr:hypothetical protein EVAR_102260_1 [Eumeta japonica]
MKAKEKRRHQRMARTLPIAAFAAPPHHTRMPVGHNFHTLGFSSSEPESMTSQLTSVECDLMGQPSLRSESIDCSQVFSPNIGYALSDVLLLTMF